jgi:hypothetical protein
MRFYKTTVLSISMVLCANVFAEPSQLSPTQAERKRVRSVMGEICTLAADADSSCVRGLNDFLFRNQPKDGQYDLFEAQAAAASCRLFNSSPSMPGFAWAFHQMACFEAAGSHFKNALLSQMIRSCDESSPGLFSWGERVSCYAEAIHGTESSSSASSLK